MIFVSVNVTCGLNEIVCPGSTVCIKLSQICDGEIDCPVGTDEDNCKGNCIGLFIKTAPSIENGRILIWIS